MFSRALTNSCRLGLWFLFLKEIISEPIRLASVPKKWDAPNNIGARRIVAPTEICDNESTNFGMSTFAQSNENIVIQRKCENPDIIVSGAMDIVFMAVP